MMPELSRLPAQLTCKALEMQRGGVLPRVRNLTPVHLLIKFQSPGSSCQLQLCLLSLEGTWWCTSSQVFLHVWVESSSFYHLVLKGGQTVGLLAGQGHLGLDGEDEEDRCGGEEAGRGLSAEHNL